MGHLIIYDKHNRPVEILGDEVGQNEARKQLGIPHYRKGRLVTEKQLKAIDEKGR